MAQFSLYVIKLRCAVLSINVFLQTHRRTSNYKKFRKIVRRDVVVLMRILQLKGPLKLQYKTLKLMQDLRVKQIDQNKTNKFKEVNHLQMHQTNHNGYKIIILMVEKRLTYQFKSRMAATLLSQKILLALSKILIILKTLPTCHNIVINTMFQRCPHELISFKLSKEPRILQS